MPSKKFVEKSGSKKGKGKKEPKPAATRASEGVTVEGLIEQGNVALSSLEVYEEYVVVLQSMILISVSLHAA